MISVETNGRRLAAVTDANGRYLVSNVASGKVTVTGQLQGFKTTRRNVQFDQRPQLVDLRLDVGGTTESVTVTAESPAVFPVGTPWPNEQARQSADTSPSQNVQNLQRRASGVLPVRMDIPRAGTSHRFVKPLVIDEETVVAFRYRRR
jgi:hypothetical protein